MSAESLKKVKILVLGDTGELPLSLSPSLSPSPFLPAVGGWLLLYLSVVWSWSLCYIPQLSA